MSKLVVNINPATHWVDASLADPKDPHRPWFVFSGPLAHWPILWAKLTATMNDSVQRIIDGSNPPREEVQRFIHEGEERNGN